jgi:DNA-binding XRE family transcriptional regulator
MMNNTVAMNGPHRAEIRATREKYGPSQTALARVLGFGDKTITRYENEY